MHRAKRSRRAGAFAPVTKKNIAGATTKGRTKENIFYWFIVANDYGAEARAKEQERKKKSTRERGKGEWWIKAVCVVYWWLITKVRYKNEDTNKKACNARPQGHYGYVFNYPCGAIRTMTTRTHHHTSVAIIP